MRERERANGSQIKSQRPPNIELDAKVFNKLYKKRARRRHKIRFLKNKAKKKEEKNHL